MRGLISFHPIDPNLFENLVEPLVMGEKVNPESYLQRAYRQREAAWACAGYKRGLVHLRDQLQPPPVRTEGSVWDKVSSRLERLGHRPDPIAVLLQDKLIPDLHLEGRPFLVTESSPDQVARLVAEFADDVGAADIESLILEQIVRLDPALAGKVEPLHDRHLGSEMAYKSELLAELRRLHELGKAARSGGGWGAAGKRRPATEALAESLPFLALQVHARAVPFWIARDVDGLDTICGAAELELPAFLSTARALFPRSLAAFPELEGAFHADLRSADDVATYVAPDRIDDLLTFLSDNGGRVIQAATRHGEGAAAGVLLRKIRECAAFARSRSMGYLEGSGVMPPSPVDDPDDLGVH